ncbi:hypothetical protein GCT62_06190, partial [Yersinia enterocolitica]|nr:hypothetical protein [Yersinia enterocolitica]
YEISASVELCVDVIKRQAYCGGLLAKIRNGDRVRVDGVSGELSLLVDEAELATRHLALPDISAFHVGCGRELFAALREQLTGAEQGACCIRF